MNGWGAYLAFGCSNEYSHPPIGNRLAQTISSQTTESNEMLFDRMEDSFMKKLCLSKFSSRIAVEFLRSRLCADDGPIRLKRLLGYVLDVLNNSNKKAAFPKIVQANWQCGCPNIIKGLRACPIWNTSEFPWIRILEGASAGIYLELMALRGQKSFQPYRSPISPITTPSSSSHRPDELADSLGALGTTTGDWNVCYLHLHGLDVGDSLLKCPITAAAIEAIPRQYRHAFFSALAHSTHVAKHHGSTNKKLRCHLPLKVPKNDKNMGLLPSSLPSISSTSTSISSSRSSLPTSTSCCWLRVADQIVELEEGVAVVFDDSFEHEAANEHPTQPRVVLVVDFWHPDFDDEEVKFLEFVNKGQMSSLKSGILQKTEVPDQSEDIASTNNIAPSIHTSTLDKREIELDNFLTVIRRAKEKADTVSESDVWGL